MTILLVMSDVVLPLAEIKKRLSEIVDGVEGRHDRVVLTRHGRPAAVIMSPDELESLEETLDLLSDPIAMREIREGEAAVAAGDVASGQELRVKYLKQCRRGRSSWRDRPNGLSFDSPKGSLRR